MIARHAHVSQALAEALEGAPKAAIALANYLFRVCIGGKLEEVELYNLPLGESRATEKHKGKRYAPNTLRAALRKLKELKLVIVDKDYKGGIFRLTVNHPGGKRPFEASIKNLSVQSQNRSVHPKNDRIRTSKPDSVVPITEKAELTDLYPPNPQIPDEPSQEKEWEVSEDVWATVAADCDRLEQEQTPTPNFVEIPEEIFVVEPEIQSVDQPVTANENYSQEVQPTAEFVESPTVDECCPQPTAPGAGFSQRPTPKPIKRADCTKEVWEIAPGRPYPVFLNWRAKTKYEPQEGRWAADALGNAYSEFYNNRTKTTVAIFPQFLEFMKKSAENCNQAEFAGLKAILPSLFVALPDPTEENVQQLMDNVQRLINGGASVALTQGIGTSSCNQAIRWGEAVNTAIAPLNQLKPSESPCLPATTEDISLASVIERKRSLWRNAPVLRDAIKKWVSETDGVELGEDGPVLPT